MLDVARPGPDYTLRWPRELLVVEARALLGADASPKQVEWLLEEAFAGSTPVRTSAARPRPRAGSTTTRP